MESPFKWLCRRQLRFTVAAVSSQVLIKVKTLSRRRFMMATETAVQRMKRVVSGRRPRLAHVSMLAFAALCCAQPTKAQDAVRGRDLYATYCGDCHYERVHERDRAKSRVQTLEELRGQVARWSAQTRRPLSAEDLVDIVDYLNRSHYRLDK
jgi:hypothetical protein